MLRKLVIPLALLMAIAPPLISPAVAQDYSALSANPYIQRGLIFYNDQKYQEAQKAFLTAYRWNKTIKKDRLTALKYLAFISIILNKPREAERYFRTLLRIDHNFQLNNVWDPPKFVRFFNKVKKKFLSERRVKITVLTKGEVQRKKNQPLTLQFKVVDKMSRLKKLELYYRIEQYPIYRKALIYRRKRAEKSKPEPAKKKTAKPTTQSTTKRARRKREFVLSYKVPAGFFENLEDRAYMFEFYLQGYDVKNRIIVKVGDERAPKKIKLLPPAVEKKPPPPSVPIYKKWWFWTIVGGVVVGGGAAAIAAILSNRTPPPPKKGEVIITIIR